MVERRNGGIVFPQRAGRQRHVVEVAFDVIKDFLEVVVLCHHVKAQIVADERVCEVNLGILIVFLSPRTEIVEQRVPELRVQFLGRGTAVERIVLADFRNVALQIKLSAFVFRLKALGKLPCRLRRCKIRRFLCKI